MIPRRQRPWRIPARLPSLGLLLLAALSPSLTRASIPDLATTARPFEDYSLSRPTSPVDEIEQREAGRAACGAFCGEPLGLALDGRFGSREASVDTQDAWGVFRNPDEMNGPSASKNRFAFTGYVFDRETELYFAKARFYDPTVGRFTSQDSFLGEIDRPPSLHRYFYGHANPLRYVDPDGHQALGTLARERGRGEFSGLQSAAEVQSAGAKPSDLDPRLDPDSAEYDPTAVALEEGLEYVEEHGLRGVPGVVYEPTPANKPSLLSRTMRRADDVLSYAGRKAREKTEEFGGAVLREPLGANKPKPPLTREDIAWAQHSAGDQRLKTRLQDVPAGLAEGAAHGAAIGVKVGVDAVQAKAAGKGLEAIADEAKAVRASRAAARNAKVAVAPNKGVATTPWGTRDVASGKYSKGPRGGLDPVDDFIAKAEANGFEVVGREVTFDTPFGQRRPDVLLRDLRTGKIQGVEIKSSPREFARFNAQQQAADKFINRWGAKATGDKAKDLGVGRIEGISKILWEVQ